MKLGTKLSLAMGGLVGLMAGLGAFCLIQMDGINNSSIVIAQEWLPKALLAEEMNTFVLGFRVQQFQHAIAQTPADMKEAERAMASLRTSFERRAVELEKLITVPQGREIFNQTMSLWANYVRQGEEIRTLSRENRTAEAIALLNGKTKDDYDAMYAILLQLVNTATDGAQAASAQSDAAYASSRAMVLGMLIMAVLPAVGLALYIVRNTLRQLGKDPGERAVLAREAAGGTLDLDNDDKAVDMCAEILVMVENLKTQIENAREESRRRTRPCCTPTRRLYPAQDRRECEDGP